MRNKLLHTPEGVRDIYNSEMEKKMLLQSKLQELVLNYGFAAIQTPTFEYFDIFGNEIGTTPSKELYKFFDREGNTLVLRPDITPSIARAAAKYYMDDTMPLRFSYLGNTFTNNSSYQGRLKETTELGAEIIGDGSIDADAEMIAMVVDCFLCAGLSEFQISIGHVGFFQAICDAAKLSSETVSSIREFIYAKNYFGALEVIDNCDITSEMKECFNMLPILNGGADSLAKAKEVAAAIPDAIKAIEHLEALNELLKCYGYENYVSFDLSFLSRYDYYTGIVFDGYTFGSGEAIAKGGRYDELLQHFGKQSPAVGFMILMDQLQLALSRQNIELDISKKRVLLLYSDAKREEAIRQAKGMRNAGTSVELMPLSLGYSEEEIEKYSKRCAITEKLIME